MQFRKNVSGVGANIFGERNLTPYSPKTLWYLKQNLHILDSSSRAPRPGYRDQTVLGRRGGCHVLMKTILPPKQMLPPCLLNKEQALSGLYSMSAVFLTPG